MRLPWREPRLEPITRNGDLAGLIEMLRRRDVLIDSDGRSVDLAAPTRAAAALALAKQDGPVVVRALSDALLDPIAPVRAATLESIAAHPRPELCATVARVLPSWPADQTDLRERALDILLQQGDVWLAVFHAEALLEDQNGGDVTTTNEEAQRRLMTAPDADGVLDAFARRLVHRLSLPDGLERRRVCAVLAAFGPLAVHPLADALDDPARCIVAATTLGRLRDPHAIRPLSRLLDADDPELRVAAAVALKGVGHPGTAEALIRASFDEREEVREAAQAGLDELRTVDLLAGLAAVIGPMAERLEQLERAAGKRNASDLPDAPVPLLRRLLERRTRD